MRHLSIILIAITYSFSGYAQSFNTGKEYEKAYSLLLDLHFIEASDHIEKLKKSEPDNLSPIYLQDLSDFLFIVVTEDQDQFEARKPLRSQRLKALNQLPNSSPYKLLAEGEIHLHWAFSMMRFGEYLSGAREINRAFKALEKNIELFPDFLPTYKSMGLLHTLVGTVPDNYRWATNLMGVDGTIEQGIAEMESVISRSNGKSEYKNLRKETLFLLSFLHINLLNDGEALVGYQNQIENESGPLMDFAKASLHKAMGQTDKAIEILMVSPSARNSFPYLNFLLGELKLARMDKDASVYFQQYLKSFRGNSYLKSAHQKTAWHSLLSNGDEKTYFKIISYVDKVGNTMLDEDRSAQKEFEETKVPNIVLLKARLQFDGGFYTEALSTLINSSSGSIKTSEEELEFTYRLGRIYDAMGKDQKAIDYYTMTIKNGAESKRYFAANASLHMGMIYERNNERQKALAAFKDCSRFKNSEYRNSIIQKAKAGIDRVTD